MNAKPWLVRSSPLTLPCSQRERLGRHGRREAEAGERFLAREQARVADGQAARASRRGRDRPGVLISVGDLVGDLRGLGLRLLVLDLIFELRPHVGERPVVGGLLVGRA